MTSFPSSLTSLPFEVRNLIHLSIIGFSPPSVIVFYNKITQKITRYTSILPTAWLRTCRLIHAEGWALIASLTMFVWSLHSSRTFAPIPRNQLSDVLCPTFLRKLRRLEVMEGCLPPTRELLTMWELQSVTVQILHREEIKKPLNRLSLRELLDDSKAMENAVSILPVHSQPDNMPFLRARTKIYIRLKANFWHTDQPQYWNTDYGFCICLGLRFEIATREVMEKDIWLNETTTSDGRGFFTWAKVQRGDEDAKFSDLEKKLKKAGMWVSGPVGA